MSSKNFLMPVMALVLMALPNLAKAQVNLQGCTYNNLNMLCAKNVKYGKDALNTLDIWRPKYTTGPLPLVIYIHGGGYYTGDKSSAYDRSPVNPETIVKSGMAFATINYRLSPDNPYLKGETGQYPVQMSDSALALQFLRFNASSLGIDKNKVVLSGSSAGGGISLWLTLHNDLAKPKSTNLIARESSRVKCTVLMETQPTLNIPEVISLLDPDGFELDEGLPGLYGTTAADYLNMSEYFDVVLKDSYAEASPMTHLSADDATAKLLLSYTYGLGIGDIHSPELGIYFATGQPANLKKKYGRKSLDEIGLEYELYYGQKPSQSKDRVLKFIKEKCPQVF